MEFASMGDIGKALKHWRGLLVLDECDAARVSGLMLTILYKLLSTQEVRVLCTSRSAGRPSILWCYSSPRARTRTPWRPGSTRSSLAESARRKMENRADARRCMLMLHDSSVGTC